MKKEYVYAGLTILLWGTFATASKLVLQHMDAMLVLAVASLLATVFLLVTVRKARPIAQIRHLPASAIVKMVGYGLLGVFFCNWFLLLGTTLLPAQTAFVINYFWPAFVILFASMFLKERLTVGKIAAILLSLAGIAVVVTNGDFSRLAPNSLKGVVFCVVAAASYALFATLNKREDFDKTLSMILSFGSSAVIAFLAVFLQGTFRLPTFAEALGLAYIGVLCFGLAYLLWALAMDLGNTALLANSAYLTPFVSLLATHFVLKEPIGVFSVAGLLLIVLGLGIQIVGEKKTSQVQESNPSCT